MLTVNSMRKILLIIFVLAIISPSVIAQLSVGPYFTTNHFPAVPLRVNGFGVGAEVSDFLAFSLDHFSKKYPVDSLFEVNANDGTGSYTKFQKKYSVLHFSGTIYIDVLRNLDNFENVSLSLGGGLAGIYRFGEIDFPEVPSAQKLHDNQFIFGFAYHAGLGYDFDAVKIFVKAQGTILLHHVIPGNYDTAMPYLTNTQFGILFPLNKL